MGLMDLTADNIDMMTDVVAAVDADGMGDQTDTDDEEMTAGHDEVVGMANIEAVDVADSHEIAAGLADAKELNCLR